MELVSTEHPHVLLITGMSGAGRSSAAKVIEDLGYAVIDNLPPSLLAQAVKSHDIPEQHKHLALVIDSRGGLPTEELKSAIVELARDGVQTRIVFLDAEDDVIVRRYEENRRPHPLGEPTITSAITAERDMLVELREMSDYYIDTSNLNIHQLREQLTTLFADEDMTEPMRVSVRSFGFKHGSPRDVDLMFDVRFLPNPHWVPELRDRRGTDEPVSDYVLGTEGAGQFVDQVENMLLFLIPRFEAEGKSYLSVGIGCTGGHHRSVAIAEELGKRLNKRNVRAVVRHRDIDN
ncbi:MAG: RNase adapter RapZ [Actinobacteria bacterium]|nr:MAG: RNase adapter RapZ [Actinomycetota bacterium]REK40619.1 MAG: RNase adapter RapZ [Actinomycetota bacterium]